MRSPLRARMWRLLVAAGLSAALLLPAASTSIEAAPDITGPCPLPCLAAASVVISETFRIELKYWGQLLRNARTASTRRC